MIVFGFIGLVSELCWATGRRMPDNLPGQIVLTQHAVHKLEIAKAISAQHSVRAAMSWGNY
jgi:hypothetical protein